MLTRLGFGLKKKHGNVLVWVCMPIYLVTCTENILFFLGLFIHSFFPSLLPAECPLSLKLSILLYSTTTATDSVPKIPLFTVHCSSVQCTWWFSIVNSAVHCRAQECLVLCTVRWCFVGPELWRRSSVSAAYLVITTYALCPGLCVVCTV